MSLLRFWYKWRTQHVNPERSREVEEGLCVALLCSCSTHSFPHLCSLTLHNDIALPGLQKEL